MQIHHKIWHYFCNIYSFISKLKGYLLLKAKLSKKAKQSKSTHITFVVTNIRKLQTTTQKNTNLKKYKPYSYHFHLQFHITSHFICIPRSCCSLVPIQHKPSLCFPTLPFVLLVHSPLVSLVAPVCIFIFFHFISFSGPMTCDCNNNLYKKITNLEKKKKLTRGAFVR